MEPIKVPVIKKDSEVTVTLNTNEISSIVQAIFFISKDWTPADVESIKKGILEKTTFTDPKQITFLLLDRVYKKLLREAQAKGLTEETDFTIPSPIEGTSNPTLEK